MPSSTTHRAMIALLTVTVFILLLACAPASPTGQAEEPKPQTTEKPNQEEKPTQIPTHTQAGKPQQQADPYTRPGRPSKTDRSAQPHAT